MENFVSVQFLFFLEWVFIFKNANQQRYKWISSWSPSFDTKKQKMDSV